MNHAIFREYDIRGIIGKELELDEAYSIGQAIVTYFIQNNPATRQIIVGMDGRSSSPSIKSSLAKAALDAGLDVIDIGLCTTPIFYYSLFTTNTGTGVMVTASHNPKEYNGIKISLDRQSISGARLQEVKKILIDGSFYTQPSGTKGTIIPYDATHSYLNWQLDHFAHLKGKTVNAVIDCGNSPGSIIMPQIAAGLEWKNVQFICSRVDGSFPNHTADPTEEHNMLCTKKALAADSTLTVGIGFDGDCDRMAPMTASGYLVPGDQLLGLFSQQVLAENPGSAIVFDIKCSGSLMEVVEKAGGTSVMVPSGHSTIKREMKANNAKLAGELSCHFFFNDRYFGYDDGIYAALRLIELMLTSGKSLDELGSLFPDKVRTAEIRIPCAEEDKLTVVNHVKGIFAQRSDSRLITVDGIRAHMDYGWGLLRASNTQALVCLRFEADTELGLARVKQDFYDAMTPYFDAALLKEKIELH